MAAAKKAAAKPPEPSAQGKGEVVESESAGAGDAINVVTGEVTPGGEPLPPVPDDGDDQSVTAGPDSAAVAPDTADPTPDAGAAAPGPLRAGGHVNRGDGRGWVLEKE